MENSPSNDDGTGAQNSTAASLQPETFPRDGQNFSRNDTAPRNDGGSVWFQGIVLGVIIAAAFAIGWWLALRDDKSNFSARNDTVAILPQPAPAGAIPVQTPPELAPVFPPQIPVEMTPPAAQEDTPAAIPEVPVSIQPLPPPAPAKIAIITEPNAEVFIVSDDGEKVRSLGIADVRGQLFASEMMTAKDAEVELYFQHPTCKPVRREGVILQAGKTLDIVAPMTAHPGSLVIIVDPPTAEVWLDDEKVGRGFVMLGAIASRINHNVEVRAEKSEPVSRQVSVQPNEVTTLRLNIEPSAENTGDLLLIGITRTLAAQPGAIVKVDGKVTSAEDGLVRRVLPGEHNVVIELPGASEKIPSRILWEKRVHVEVGSATSLTDDPVLLERDPAVAVEEKPKDEGVHLTLTLLDEKAKPIRAEKTEVAFGGKKLKSLDDGRWPVPFDVQGILTVKIPGYEISARPVHFMKQGDYTIVCLMKTAPEENDTAAGKTPLAPPKTSWKTSVLAVSGVDGIIVLAKSPEGVISEKQHLKIVATFLPDPFEVLVSEVGPSMIVCEIIPSRTRIILPEKNAEVTVTIMSLSQ